MSDTKNYECDNCGSTYGILIFKAEADHDLGDITFCPFCSSEVINISEDILINEEDYEEDDLDLDEILYRKEENEYE